MTIAVFGATGQLGAHIIDSLIARGTDAGTIRALGRNTERLAELAAKGVETAQVDLDDAAAVAPALEGAETVVLVSTSVPGQRMPQHTNAINGAKGAGVQHLVYTSLLRADTSELALAAEHVATDQLIAESGIPATILRNGWYTENHQRDFEIGRSGTIANSVGDAKLATASRADYAEAAAVVAADASHAGKTYELAGDDAWTFADFAAVEADVLGQPVAYQAISADEDRAQLLAAGLDEGSAGFVAGMNQAIAGGALDSSSRELSQLIGRPTTPLRDVLAAWV
ncbi:NmrA family NAD(P)-binding protein [Gulosibacter sp. ACHW.36C]|uniref:NmrA family NAD(P)-binding protein n=1 Tax=Gulosibacter sediminis TaxID=1729695 RepID=A0ABY4MUN4_9MICO|nr:NmrA family NAD(P)-binding protein [Gulosibacter sediminis]UQN14136.1 NmrA family NAD(P)-binding protein [Gulosibacter sediminis]